MVPGMFHCSGGVGCSTVDWLTPMVEWVEKGVAPEALTGAHVESGETRRTRPICPYPQVAKFKGTGSIDDAANFACAEPAPSSKSD
jgi:feruloyl esterase